MQSRISIVSAGSKASSSRKSPAAGGRRSSVGRRGSQIILPVLPTVNVEEDQSKQEQAQNVKIATIAPEILTPPGKALVRSWNPQEDYFELRIWASSPLQKGPRVVLTAADAKARSTVPRRNRQWEGTVRTLARTAGNLEGAHEESWWATCSDVARHARFGLNEQLDTVLADLRRFNLEDTNDDPDLFKFCHKHSHGGFMLLDCVGKELGTPVRY
ncbi:unnamed protein product [Symbiodinium pilosum]|uniref:Uncharacterized protein n=1 Tax=Symbiodinium pilosum TaxID=2952 RepID=A0A812W2J3_SYMPI|nr:unnamed protein product [Symbiodinium pilosum]